MAEEEIYKGYKLRPVSFSICYSHPSSCIRMKYRRRLETSNPKEKILERQPLGSARRYVGQGRPELVSERVYALTFAQWLSLDATPNIARCRKEILRGSPSLSHN